VRAIAPADKRDRGRALLMLAMTNNHHERDTADYREAATQPEEFSL
jgi:hypothetical protein